MMIVLLGGCQIIKRGCLFFAEGLHFADDHRNYRNFNE